MEDKCNFNIKIPHPNGNSYTIELCGNDTEWIITTNDRRIQNRYYACQRHKNKVFNNFENGHNNNIQISYSNVNIHQLKK